MCYYIVHVGFQIKIQKLFGHKTFWWGSNGNACSVAVSLYLGNKLLGNDLKGSVNTLNQTVNYILGVNPLSLSYVTGEGENSVKNIYSGIYTADGIDEVPKGYMPGGANKYESDFMSRFAGKCYSDLDGEWTSNEHAIYWNANFVFCLAASMAN